MNKSKHLVIQIKILIQMIILIKYYLLIKLIKQIKHIKLIFKIINNNNKKNEIHKLKIDFIMLKNFTLNKKITGLIKVINLKV
jgi:hypothetical protein